MAAEEPSAPASSSSSSTPAADLPPIEEYPHKFSDGLASRLGLQLRPGWNYTDAAGKAPGYLRVLPSGRVKATCRRHEKCTFFRNTRGEDFDSTCKLMIRWLHCAAAAECSQAARQEAARRLVSV